MGFVMLGIASLTPIGINAAMIGMEKKLGSIEVGKQADLVVLDKNPLTNIKDIATTKYVFKQGKLVK